MGADLGPEVPELDFAAVAGLGRGFALPARWHRRVGRPGRRRGSVRSEELGRAEQLGHGALRRPLHGRPGYPRRAAPDRPGDGRGLARAGALPFAVYAALGDTGLVERSFARLAG